MLAEAGSRVEQKCEPLAKKLLFSRGIFYGKASSFFPALSRVRRCACRVGLRLSGVIGGG
jgi:hypothetical protein